MKNLLIIPAMPDYVPYIRTYTDIMDSLRVEYDLLCWNRKGENLDLPDNYIVYTAPTDDTYPYLRKIYENYKFYRFAKSLLKRQKYNCIFVFTIITGLLFKDILIRQYKGRYLFDIRDYSPVMSLGVAVLRLKKLLRNSYVNVISSDGFREWLPKNEHYITTHNVRLADIQHYNRCYFPLEDKEEISVINIGSIRDVSSNTMLIDQLGNKDKVKLIFVGLGPAVPELKKNASLRNISNISFYGRYEKKEEINWVKKADLINSYLPRTMVGDYLMSNRFYLSVMLRKPLIVNEGSFQAEMVRKFNLGVVLSPYDDMYEKIMTYWEQIDWVQYNQNCENFIEILTRDLLNHERWIKLLLQSSMTSAEKK